MSVRTALTDIQLPQSKSIRLRFVEESDADFILSLRLDSKYNKYLSPVSRDIDKQKEWIRAYKKLESDGSEYYFIIERHDGIRCGTVRMYDFKDNSFSWGSWILNEDKPRTAALETALLIYKAGFEILGFDRSHFEVNRNNTRVISFHSRLGAEKVSEDNENFYFIFTSETYQKCSGEFHYLLEK